MVVPALASAQEPGSTDTDPSLTEEVTADETTTEAPPAEVPPTPPPAPEPVEPVAPVETTPPAPVEETAGFEGSTDTSKASTEPAAPREPATAPAAAPETESADVAAVKAEATDSPGNGGGGSRATAGRALADGGGKLEATKASSESKPGCLARGDLGNQIHDDLGCAFVTDQGLPHEPSVGCVPGPEGPGQECWELVVEGPNGPVYLDIWLTDLDGHVEGNRDTVNVTVLSGGPIGLQMFVKGAPRHTLHSQCDFSFVQTGETRSCTTLVNPQNGHFYPFNHVDICVREADVPPPPPPPGLVPEEETPPDRNDDGREDERDELAEDREEQEQLDEFAEAAVPPAVIPTAVAAAPDEALPFTGLDTGWLVLMSIALLGSGIVLRRTVS